MEGGGVVSADVQGAPLVTFAIPFHHRRSDPHWADACRLVAYTIGSILAQTDGRLRVVVVATDAPDLPMSDPRIEILLLDLPVTQAFQAGMRDKLRRLTAAADDLCARGGGYFMPVDNDDLLSKRLVGFVAQTMDPNGYKISRGYVLDASRMTAAPLPLPAINKDPFHKVCGTSSIVRLAPADMVDGADGKPSRFSRLREIDHVSVVRAAEAEGRPLLEVPFPAAVYVVETGLNSSGNQTRRPEVREERLGFVDRVRRNAGPIDAIVEEFAIPASFGIAKAAQNPRPATLSVAIATHRRPEGLRRLLTALAPQVEGRGDREIVVVNDGSHDTAYAEVARDFAAVLRYRALERNGGVAAARNAVAAMARGDYLIYIDDDCVPPPWWLDWIDARLRTAPELDVVAGAVRPLRTGREGLIARIQAHHHLLPSPWKVHGTILFATANVALRKELFSKVGGFGYPGAFHGAAEDTELSSRLSNANARETLDWDWWVSHDVGEPLVKLCRRFWRYGFANGSLMMLTSSPSAHDGLGWYQRKRHIRNTWVEFRRQWKTAKNFSQFIGMRLLAAVVATLVKMSYYDGCAAGIKARQQSTRVPDVAIAG